MSLAKLKLIAGFAAIAVLSAGCDGGKLLAQAPAAATGGVVSTPTATPANLFINTTTPVQGADGKSTITITATVTDASNVAIRGASVAFVAAPVAPATSCNCSLSAGTVASGADGTAQSVLSGSVPGQISVTITVSPLPARTVIVTIPTNSSSTTPSGSPANLFVNTTTPAQGTGGTTTVTITAIVTDSNNVAINNTNVTFAAAPVAPATSCNCALSKGSVATTSDGSAQTVLTASSAGQISVTISVSPLAPRTITITIPASTSGTTPSGTPRNLLLVASAPTQQAGGATTLNITATVTDVNNIAISNAAVSFSAAPVAPATNCNCALTTGSVTTAADGTARTVLSATSSGQVRITATVNGVTPQMVTVTIPASPVFRLGMLGDGAGSLCSNRFIPDKILVGQPSIAAGGSSGLQVTIFDTANCVPFTTAATVNFTSTCITANRATVPSVTGSTGTFDATYTARGCSGTDTVSATTVAAGTNLTATGDVTVASPALGSIAFDRVVPATAVINLKGVGGTETAQVFFTVRDTSGAAFAGATVSFALTTTVGKLSLQTATATSDGAGSVNAVVRSGTVHTTVRVIATVTVAGNTINTQSNLLTVSTGFPTQNGLSLSATKLNLVGNDIDGNSSDITAILSDRYGNPAPDGTAVSFSTECGQIQPQCTTIGGTCKVKFTTANPRTLPRMGTVGSPTPQATTNQCFGVGRTTADRGCDDHRCTILATAIGEESFDDCNGQGVYISTTSARNNNAACPMGNFFASLPEAFLDSNENGQILTAGAGSALEGGETPVDFNLNGTYDVATGRFIGLLCSTTASDPNFDPNCEPGRSSLNISRGLAIVMSSSALKVSIQSVAPPAATTANYIFPATTPIPVIPFKGTRTVSVTVGDSQGQLPEGGTIVSAGISLGSIVAPTSYTVPNSNAFGFITGPITIKAPDDATGGTTAALTITATQPGTTATVASFAVCYSSPLLSINSPSVVEGNAGTSALVFTVTRSALSGCDTSTATVNFATADGTATAGSDYVAQNGVLTFLSGETSKTVSVVINGDGTTEPDETLTVTLSAPVNATLGTATGTGTIINDD